MIARTLVAMATITIACAAISCDGGDDALSTASATHTSTPAPTPTPKPAVTTLLFTGDIIPARCTYARLEAIGDYTAPFHALRDILTSADITAGTLDTTISTVARPIGCTPTFNLASPARVVEGLLYAGFDVVAHAANHIKDCGAVNCGDRAMFETLWLLRSAGIAPVGSGGDVMEARRPAVIERNGVRFAFLAYDDIAPYYHAGPQTAGSVPLDASTLAADVAAARDVADVVIVVPHWGVEYVATPTERQRALARVAAIAGADLVVGNHPHWAQAHEQIGETFVAYALGNFVFDQDWSAETQQGAMLEVTFEGDAMAGYRYIPVRIHDEYQPRLAAPAEAEEIMRRIESASAALTAP